MTGAESPLAAQVTVGIALLAGMAYFFSPCVWPLYPAYLAWLGGTGPAPAGLDVPGAPPPADEPGPRGPRPGAGRGPRAGGGHRRWAWSRRLAGAAGFVVGLGLVFMALGASLSALGALLVAYRTTLERVAGVLIATFGLQMLGILRWRWLQREWRVGWAAPRGAGGFLPGVLMGAAFGMGWTPCVGPVLGSILLLASSTATVWQGVLLLAAFTVGFAVPFLSLAVLLDRLEPGWLRRGGAALPWIERASGAALVVLGVLVFTGQLARLSSWLWYTVAPWGG
ncbi:cytochrome c biogenesis protein CcdA [Thermaerobacter sp. FW80]|uniref:cytochrome c biogenesis CcdA family protein n=1 Tax=Thermaerobacter sp. FW80 TaxID=2546351 RepID=UPI001074AF82|nr:cytochrome c biogenesis protein CcdA [Thermaerobacter sp. FW80]QBS36810.1 cytochrome c biogenesis protein CcdA [Thermaerobacter sp. FW80]